MGPIRYFWCHSVPRLWWNFAKPNNLVGNVAGRNYLIRSPWFNFRCNKQEFDEQRCDPHNCVSTWNDSKLEDCCEWYRPIVGWSENSYRCYCNHSVFCVHRGK
ncbi:MAG: hypothetical protein EBQ86_11915, partial [Betaproteobacteria bacterium]|nr:hypothetical protein [Betaproteobacteria bacterium]